MSEEWRRIPSFPDYQVSSLGRVRRGERVLRPFPAKYMLLRLRVDGKRPCRGVHALVAEAFLGVRPEGCEVNHKDGNKHNNRAANLEYVTSSGNKLHAVARGYYPTGVRHWRAKLTEAEVREIRRLRAELGWGKRRIARAIGHPPGRVGNVLGGWRQVA